ncbi:lysophospholipid acyltransferase family protein [Desulfoplanes sp.]
MQLYHLAPVVSGLFRLWGSTLRFSRVNYQAMTSMEEQGQSMIFALWHDELFPLTYLHRNEGVVAVVSSSKDGEILAKVMERLGYGTVRGSSSRKGLKALLAALKEVRTGGRNVVLTVDGPRGPRHQAKPGAIFLASKAQVPIMPVRIRISRAKVFHKAWDKFQLPLPLARCEAVYGEPYMVPETLNASTMAGEEERLTATLESLV